MKVEDFKKKEVRYTDIISVWISAEDKKFIKENNINPSKLFRFTLNELKSTNLQESTK
jgi:hypothetical protein